nr:GNAT family N-acetyltransferase [Lysinibacillus timonensis]
MKIRQLIQSDLNEVLRIYEEGMETGCATFETKVPTKEIWDQKYHPTLRFVAEENGQVYGWISVSQVSRREVYKGVGEISIYINSTVRGMGVGTLLMQKMIEESENVGFWTLESSIFAINESSIALHKKRFRIVGTREKIAKRKGKWYDTIIMERRSKLIM